MRAANLKQQLMRAYTESGEECRRSVLAALPAAPGGVLLDCGCALDIPDVSVDVASANQMIEHLRDTDGFMIELQRVLKPGGIAVISTNNLASWHNIVALMLGAQPFPADVSSNFAIGKLFGPFPGDAGG